MQGKRLPLKPDGSATVPTSPGEYCGPVTGYTNGMPAVLFLKPNARDADAPRRARHVQHVVSPPHTFTEEPDGTLTIQPSLSEFPTGGGDSDGWHGYLEKGVWRKV